MTDILLIDKPISREELKSIAEQRFGDMNKELIEDKKVRDKINTIVLTIAVALGLVAIVKGRKPILKMLDDMQSPLIDRAEKRNSLIYIWAVMTGAVFGILAIALGLRELLRWIFAS